MNTCVSQPEKAQLVYAKCEECDYVQPMPDTIKGYFYCSVCDAKNEMTGRFMLFSEGKMIAMLRPKIDELLGQWDTAIVNLASNYINIRLRNCTLDFDESKQAYHITYKSSVFTMNEIELVGSWKYNNE